MDLRIKGLKHWWANLSLRFLVWISFDMADLDGMESLEGYFWVQVARCNRCGGPVNVPAILPLDKKDIQGTLEHHVIMCGEGKYPRNQKLARMQ